jgi:LemA protein
MSVTVILTLSGAFLLIYFYLHNDLVHRKNALEQAMASIDAYLKKRYDLIPNLVSSVKNYMNHESTVLKDIVNLRNRAIGAPSSQQSAVETDQKVSHALKSLMVTIENYPDLKANQNFAQLNAALNEVEEQLSAARRSYNAAATRYNNGVEMLPHSLVAGILGYTPRPLFEVSEVEAATPSVSNLFKIS